jgi:hypothetical protein
MVRWYVRAVSVRIEPIRLARAVERRPFAYVVTASSTQRAHLRAVVVETVGEWFSIRVGSQTADNVGRTSGLTLLWPPLPASDCREEFDDHSVIADCEATAHVNGDSVDVRARAITAVWHRPAR